MSTQAIIFSIVYSILIVLSIILAIINKMFGMWNIIGSILSIAFVALFAFDTSCLTSESPCTIWSWVRTMIYVLFAVAGIILIVMTMFKGKDGLNKYITKEEGELRRLEY